MLMDKNLDIDFVFGDHYLDVKKMDYTLLQHNVKEVKNIEWGPIVWQSGVIHLPLKNYDKFIILGEPMNISTWIVLILCKFLNKDVYLWTHGWYGRETRLKAFVKKVFFGLAKGLFLYGNYARNLMIADGFLPQKLFTIHNSLMYDEQLKLRDSLQESDIFKNYFQNQYFVVVFVGRLTKIKKLNLLVEAQSISLKRGLPFNLVFIGNGEEKEYLEGLGKKYGLSSMIWFYGATYAEKELSELLYNADLCVAPGNIGLTAMHAMVYGCPCISHNDFRWQMPEFEAIKEGVTGCFFEKDNVKSLSDSIICWHNAHANDRETVRIACYKEIDNYWNPHVQLKIIKKVIEE